MEVPQNGWLIRENPYLEWMMTVGYPYDSGNLHMGVDKQNNWEFYRNKYPW